MPINEGRGVEIDNVRHLKLQNNAYEQYNSNTLYYPNSIIEYENAQYTALLLNRTVFPTSTISKYIPSVEYSVGNFVSSTTVWTCISTLSSPANTHPPNVSSLSTVWKLMSSISTVHQIWGPLQGMTDYSYIEGSRYSYARLGAISTIALSSQTLSVSSITGDFSNYLLDLVGSGGSGSPSNWSLYPARSDVDLAGNIMGNVNAIFMKETDMANAGIQFYAKDITSTVALVYQPELNALGTDGNFIVAPTRALLCEHEQPLHLQSEQPHAQQHHR
jgi:hypothetical protein